MPKRLSRRFVEHRIRTVLSLDGRWDLYFPRQGTTIQPQSWRSGKHRTIHFPAVWESIPEYINYRGQAVARRLLHIPKPGDIRLVFKGISHTARLFLDGREVGYHHNAYTPFAIDLPNVRAGQHELWIHISNEHGDLSALHIPNDYYNYGGITRPAELQILNSRLYIRYVHFTPSRKNKTWHGKFQACIMNLGKPCPAALSIRLAGITVQFPEQQFPTGKTTLTTTQTFPLVIPWEPRTPKLYPLIATLSSHDEIVDDWRDRTGFRTISVQGTQLLLNGKPVFLQGFNRHEDHAKYGCAIPVPAMKKDLSIMRNLGSNAIRTCHYPNDERFLDLCDEQGFLVWEENHARGLDLNRMKHPLFRQQCRDCIDEMIHWHFNHPSIVLWGILNECASHTPEGRRLYAEQFRQIQRMDRSRPTTFATCQHGRDICMDLPDVAGVNWYFSWYGQQPVPEGTRDQLRWLNTTPAKDKPIIISEFGAGALPGYHDPIRRAKFSEERQCDILDACLKEYLRNPRFCGAFIWQFCDVRVDDSWGVSRPRSINDKGIVDGMRNPKMSGATVRRHFLANRRASKL